MKKKNFQTKLSPIYKAIDITRKKLDKKKSLNFFYWCTMDFYCLHVES